jgi:hypothetical protein
MSGKVWAWVAGIAAAVIAAVIVATLGINAQLGVTIDGPTTAPFGNRVVFRLVGHVNGSYDSAYWTDTFGQRLAFNSNGDWFICPSTGQFTITLTAVSNGNQAQASHTVSCVFVGTS